MRLVNNNQTIVVNKPTNTAKKQELAGLKAQYNDCKVELDTIKNDILFEQKELDEKIAVSTSFDEKVISLKDSIKHNEEAIICCNI